MSKVTESEHYNDVVPMSISGNTRWFAHIFFFCLLIVNSLDFDLKIYQITTIISYLFNRLRFGSWNDLNGKPYSTISITILIRFIWNGMWRDGWMFWCLKTWIVFFLFFYLTNRSWARAKLCIIIGILVILALFFSSSFQGSFNW